MNARVIAFGVLCLVQLGAAASGIARYERVLSSGKAVLLEVAPVDPSDPFRGRYVTLSFALTRTPHPLKGQAPEYDGTAYIVLKLDAQNVATVDYVTATRPTSGLWLEGEHASPDDTGKQYYVGLPFDRFYMNEELAPAAELAYRDAVTSERGRSHARVRLANGTAVIEDVLLDGVSIDKAARER
jgi:uncharacterized membrane-anchored protein